MFAPSDFSMQQVLANLSKIGPNRYLNATGPIPTQLITNSCKFKPAGEALSGFKMEIRTRYGLSS